MLIEKILLAVCILAVPASIAAGYKLKDMSCYISAAAFAVNAALFAAYIGG